MLDRDPFAFTCSIQMKQHVHVWAGGGGRAGGWYMLISQWGKLNEELNMDTECDYVCESHDQCWLEVIFHERRQQKLSVHLF